MPPAGDSVPAPRPVPGPSGRGAAGGPPNSRRDRDARGHQQPPWKSSLDLVWSYSRSQAFYAENIGTSPSFVDHYSPLPGASDEDSETYGTSDSFDDDEDEDEEEYYDDDESYSDEEGHHHAYRPTEDAEAPANEGVAPSEAGSEADGTEVDVRGEAHWDGQQLPSNARPQEGGPPGTQGLSNLSRAALQSRTDKLRKLADEEGSQEDSSERGRGRRRSRSGAAQDGLLHPPSGTEDRRLSGEASSATSNKGVLGARESRSLSSSTSGERRPARARPTSSTVPRPISDTAPVMGEQAPLLSGGAKRRSSAQVGTQARRRSTLIHPHAAPGVAYPAGTSTFLQSWFNTLNAVMGVGILAMPLAFSYAGWIGGPLLFLVCGGLTNYTGKVLFGILARNGRLRTYADIGAYAFGPRARAWVSTLFCLELWAVSVALVILFADNLHAIFPDGPGANTYKVACFAVVLPTIFLPLKLLSPVSVVGILSALTLVVVVLVDGVLKPSAPGSLWDPDSSATLYPGWGRIPLSFGLIMSGFSSHPVIPSLARDMQQPILFPQMLDRAYIAATVLYLSMGAAGYAMYGANVSDEITKDLARTPGFPSMLNKVAVWLIVINPLSKFALAARPIINTFEGALGVEEPAAVPTHHRRTSRTSRASHRTPVAVDEEGYGTLPDGRRLSRKWTTRASTASLRRSVVASVLGPSTENGKRTSLHLPTGESSDVATPAIDDQEDAWHQYARIGVQVTTSALITLTAIVLPGFEKTMAFLGSFLVITTCVIGPLLAKLKLFGREMSYACIVVDVLILAASTAAAVVGTIWTFASK